MKKRPTDEEIAKFEEEQELKRRISKGRKLQSLLEDDYYRGSGLAAKDFGEDAPHFKSLRKILKK